MGGKDYMKLFWAFVIAFASLALLAIDMESYAFGAQFILAIIALLLAMIALSAAYTERRWAYIILSAVFAAFLLDLLYLYFRTTSYLLVIMAAASAYGFVKSVDNIAPVSHGRKERGAEPRVKFGMENLRKRYGSKREMLSREIGSLEDTKPEIIIEGLKKISKKKAAKKRKAGKRKKK